MTDPEKAEMHDGTSTGFLRMIFIYWQVDSVPDCFKVSLRITMIQFNSAWSGLLEKVFLLDLTLSGKARLTARCENVRTHMSEGA
jgi:hypothetical protein